MHCVYVSNACCLAVRRLMNARAYRVLLALALLGLAARPAAARLAGTSGYSGQQGFICNVCHFGGSAPLVSLSGPATLAVNAVGAYTFTVHSAAPSIQIGAGLDVSANGGALIAGTGTQSMMDEITHTAPQPNDAHGQARWTFQWTAPATPGDFTLWAAGNSVNLDGTPFGDQPAGTTLAVTVESVAAATPTVAPAVCVGDCNSSGDVTVNEIITLVNLALGNGSVSECLAGDADHSGTVTVNEIIVAVNNALAGCPHV